MKMLSKMRKNEKGFTLIELIVVIAILAILAAIAIPRLAGFTENAKQANDKEAAAIVANAAAMHFASTGDTSIALNELVSAGLLNAADVAMKSTKFTTGITFPIAVTNNVVTVVLNGPTDPEDVTITK